MPIEAIAITKITATGMSVSCSGVVMSLKGTFTSGPNGITAKVTNAGITAITGAITKTSLSAALGMMSSFSASFTPSARLCSRPKGPLHVGADPVLHPGHDPTLPPDVEQGQQHQDDEDQHGLDDDQPDRVLAEGAEALGGVQRGEPDEGGERVVIGRLRRWW